MLHGNPPSVSSASEMRGLSGAGWQGTAPPYAKGNAKVAAIQKWNSQC